MQQPHHREVDVAIAVDGVHQGVAALGALSAARVGGSGHVGKVEKVGQFLVLAAHHYGYLVSRAQANLLLPADSHDALGPHVAEVSQPAGSGAGSHKQGYGNREYT